MISFIVIHCSATPPIMDIGASDIRKWHVEKNGWRDIGYSDVIRRDGRLEAGRPYGDTLAHASGFNSNSVAVCLVGGVDDDGESKSNFTKAQFDSLRVWISFMLLKYPGAKLLGHRDLPNVNKDCPCFDVQHWFNTGNIINERKLS